jgi:RimJ/RimL family protein N-acetyltransferase
MGVSSPHLLPQEALEVIGRGAARFAPQAGAKLRAMTLGTPAAPTLETPRLILRGWRPEDFEPYAAMLADDDTARFITAKGRGLTRAEAWNETVWLIGHWQLLGYGMFVVEERGTGAFLGRVGPLHPPWWPAFEMAWSLAPRARGRGYATEAARAAIGWSFETLPLGRIVSIIDPRNAASRRVAERLGERRTAETFTPFRDPCDVWELRREDWPAD